MQGAGQDSAGQVTPALSVGVAYTAALTAHRGTLNPALALGQVSDTLYTIYSCCWLLLL